MKLQTGHALAAIHYYIQQAEAGEALAHVELCRAVAGTPAAVEADIETLDTMEAMAERARAAAKMLTDRVRILEKGIESLKTELLTILGSQGLDELEGLTRVVRSQNNGGQPAMHLDIPVAKLEILGLTTAEHLPEDMLPFLTKTEVWILKKDALRDALKRGEQFEWARLEGRGKHLTIKPL